MGQWVKKWQMEFNLDKYEMLHFGKANQDMTYRLNAKVLGTVAVGQDAVGMKNLSKPVPDDSMIDDNQNEQWMEVGGPEAKKPKTEDQALLPENEDQVVRRPWTQQHLVVADIRLTPSLALTPPQVEQDAESMDVNVRGPDGFTPLILASLQGGGLDTGIEEEEDTKDKETLEWSFIVPWKWDSEGGA
eukprot:g42188.t1